MRSLDGSNLLLLLGDSLGNQGTEETTLGTSIIMLICYALEFGLGLLLCLESSLLERLEMSASLKAKGSDQTLDSRTDGKLLSTRYLYEITDIDLRLGVWLGIRVLCALDLSSDDILPHVIFGFQIEEFPDLGSSLGAKAFWQRGIGKAWYIRISLLDND